LHARSIQPPNTVDPEIVSVASILPRVTCSLYHQCTITQRALITNLIGKYNATKEVGCILAIRPNPVWYKYLEELLNKEEVIYKIIVDRVNEYKYLFYTQVLPNGPFKEITCSRDDISEDSASSTPNPYEGSVLWHQQNHGETAQLSGGG
jgi:hypothetical protein